VGAEAEGVAVGRVGSDRGLEFHAWDHPVPGSRPGLCTGAYRQGRGHTGRGRKEQEAEEQRLKRAGGRGKEQEAGSLFRKSLPGLCAQGHTGRGGERAKAEGGRPQGRVVGRASRRSREQGALCHRRGGMAGQRPVRQRSRGGTTTALPWSPEGPRPPSGCPLAVNARECKAGRASSSWHLKAPVVLTIDITHTFLSCLPKGFRWH